MTSKTSSSKFGKLVMHRFKQLAWLTTLWSAGLFFALPVLQSMNLGLMTNSAGYLSRYDANKLLSDENYVVLIGVIIAGIIAACVVQAFMNSKIQNDLWLSLPIRREKLFAANLTAGAMAVLIPLTGAYILTSVLTVFTPNMSRMFEIGMVFSGYLRAAGLFLVAYAITTLWCVLSGRTIIAVLCSLFTPVMISGTMILAAFICQTEYKTFYGSILLSDNIIALCPFGPFFATAATDVSGHSMIVMDIVWVVVAVGLLILSVWLYQKRPSEKAGDALAYPKALPFVKYPLILISAAIGWLIFEAAMGGYKWAIFGAVAIGLCVFCFVNVLEKFDFRNILHHWWKFIAVMAVFGLCISVPVFDLFSYDTRLPVREKITEAKVYEFTLNGVDLNPAQYQQAITDPEVIDMLYFVSEYAVEHDMNLYNDNPITKYSKDPYKEMFIELTNPSDDIDNILTYTVDYNGFIRSYTLQVDQANVELFNAIFSSTSNIMQTNGVFTYEPGDIDLMSLEFTDISLSFTVENTEATGSEGSGSIGNIINALRSDAFLTDKKNLENAHLLGVIRLQNGRYAIPVPVYDYFTEIKNTWLWPAFEKYMMKIDPALVESIQIERLYDKYSKTLTDPTEITEFMPTLITRMDAFYNPLVSEIKGYTVIVTYKDGTVAYPVVCAERLPDWLENS